MLHGQHDRCSSLCDTIINHGGARPRGIEPRPWASKAWFLDLCGAKAGARGSSSIARLAKRRSKELCSCAAALRHVEDVSLSVTMMWGDLHSARDE